MFSGLKSHHEASRSVHQTSSNIQVLSQHDLKKNKSYISNSVFTQIEHSTLKTKEKCNVSTNAHLRSNFELDQSADGAVSVDRFPQGWVAVQGLKHTH